MVRLPISLSAKLNQRDMDMIIHSPLEGVVHKVNRATMEGIEVDDWANCVYRVNIDPDDGSVGILYMGDGMTGQALEGQYTSLSDLPQWIRGAVHVLHLCESSGEGQQLSLSDHVVGIGRKMSNHLYWLEEPKEKNDG